MINFYGDLVPLRKLEFDDTLPIKNNNSVNCFNLECAISSNSPDTNKGTLVIEPSDVVVPECSNMLFNLANNHIHDAGEQGIIDTINFCVANGISYIGAGINIDEAQKAFFFNDYAIVSFCEKNNTYLKNICEASSDSAGVNVLSIRNIQSTLDSIGSYKVIVVLHWSVEHIQTLPLHLKGMLDKITSFENVVSIVGHHPHVPQVSFTYNGVPVYPSLGNLYFPDFIILPPIRAEFNFIEAEDLVSTYHYHRVKVPTIKKWRKINKISLIVSITNERNLVHSIMSAEGKVFPTRTPLRMLFARSIIRKLGIWSVAYNALHKTEKRVFYTYWRAYNYLNRNINGLFGSLKGKNE